MQQLVSFWGCESESTRCYATDGCMCPPAEYKRGMIQIRKSEERGHFDHGWLKTFHTFSFGDYRSPHHMGFSDLRVINEDWVARGEGFPTHPHRDMEIITYVLKGNLAHKDSMGNGTNIPVGDIQYMSAGKGVRHSEFNYSPTEEVHLLQIWIEPRDSDRGAEPRYAQQTIAPAEKKGRLKLLVSPDGAAGSIAIRQDATLSASILGQGDKVEAKLAPGRRAWIQVVAGQVNCNGQSLRAGDGAGLTKESVAALEGLAPESEFLFFDLR